MAYHDETLPRALSWDKLPAMIVVTASINLDESEIEETFVRASGPCGQNVNKVSSAVQLRFDARRSPSLPDNVSVRLQKLAGSRLTSEGVIIITAQTHRSQERNRAEALAKLVEMIREAAKPPPPKRRPTKPTKGSKERRLESKRLRSQVKRGRGTPGPDD